MKQNLNKVYSGWKINGFLALVLILLLLAGSIYLIQQSVQNIEDPVYHELNTTSLVAGIIMVFLSFVSFAGFVMLEPNEARVLLFFGNYRGNLIKPGFWWINPLMSKKHSMNRILWKKSSTT